jgi:hypothetical protein
MTIATVPVRVSATRAAYFRREHIAHGWTLAGWFFGAVGVALAAVFLFMIEVTTRPPVDAVQADGSVIRTHFREIAWGRDGAIGLVLPLALAFFVLIAVFIARKLGGAWNLLTLAIGIAIGMSITTWLKDVAFDDVEWELVLLGLAAATAILLSMFVAHVYNVHDRRKAFGSANQRIAQLEQQTENDHNWIEYLYSVFDDNGIARPG